MVNLMPILINIIESIFHASHANENSNEQSHSLNQTVRTRQLSSEKEKKKRNRKTTNRFPAQLTLPPAGETFIEHYVGVQKGIEQFRESINQRTRRIKEHIERHEIPFQEHLFDQ